MHDNSANRLSRHRAGHTSSDRFLVVHYAMLTIIYGQGEITVHSADAAMLPKLLLDTNRSFWLDLEAPTSTEFALLSDVFHFHPLAIEDAMNPHQRVKLDEYEGYLFLVADEISLNLDTASKSGDNKDDEDHVQARQMSLFLGPNYLVTIHTTPVAAIEAVRNRCDRNHRLLDKGADYVLYSVLDALVDGYFPMLDSLDDKIDDLEDRIVAKPAPDMLQTIFTIKRILNILRKRVGPSREVLQALTSRDFPGIQASSLPYFRDVADHLFRTYETLDNYRDNMSGMLDAYLSQVSNEMNRVMQKLSAVATVFLPITFITGVFGMNFADQPWLKTNFWFWAFMMGALAVFTYWWFHRRRWV